MTEVSAESAECEDQVERKPGTGTEEEGARVDVGVASGAVGGGGAASCARKELDLDQVKGRMLTIAGLFEIWSNELEVL